MAVRAGAELLQVAAEDPHQLGRRGDQAHFLLGPVLELAGLAAAGVGPGCAGGRVRLVQPQLSPAGRRQHKVGAAQLERFAGA